MRRLFLGGVVLAVLAALAAVAWSLRDKGDSLDAARQAGRDAAAHDIAAGTPSIRSSMAELGNLDPKGFGIEPQTGLPWSSTRLMCGTGVDFVAYRARNEAYNKAIMAALSEGRLRNFRLGHKLRSRSAIRALFASAAPARLANLDDSLTAGKFALTLRGRAELPTIYVTRPQAEPKSLFTAYPLEMQKGTARSAHPPFKVLFTDKNTTAILRDRGGFIWTIDLPRAIVVQLIAPTH